MIANDATHVVIIHKQRYSTSFLEGQGPQLFASRPHRHACSHVLDDRIGEGAALQQRRAVRETVVVVRHRSDADDAGATSS